MGIWTFVQEQLLGMRWLNEVIGRLLAELGMDLDSRWGGSLHFFLYDVIKITLLLCLLIFGITYIQSYFTNARNKAILGRFRGLGASTAAALLGTVTPFCSCSSIPIFIGFTNVGLPLGVTFSFLISSPMVDLASLLLLAGIFGGRIALIYVIFGLLIAILGGQIIGALHLEGEIEPSVRTTEDWELFSVHTVRERLEYARDRMVHTLHQVFPYILLGVGVGAFIHNWIPAEWVQSLLGQENPFGVLMAVVVGAPMYADIFGTIPVAEALLAKGAQLGTVLSFMMAVTTLSLPSLIMLRKAVRPKLLAVFITVCGAGMILAGYLFNLIQIIVLG